MQILVTGAAGFLGSNLVDYLINFTEHNIIGLDRLDFSGNLNRIAEIAAVNEIAFRTRYRQIHHDLKAEINPLLAAQIGKVDWIIHLAAGSHVDRSIQDPLSFVMDNVVGTCNVLTFARDIGAKVYYQSTDEVFGPAPGKTLYSEWDRYKSGSPYSASKAGAEELCLAFANTYKMHVVIGHTMNAVGKRQHPEKYVPSTIRKILNRERVIIHADKTCTIPGSRFYIDAAEVSKAIHFVMEHGKAGDKYNIVGAQETDNLTLAGRIAACLGREDSFEFTLTDFHSQRPGHDLRYGLSGVKLAEMGWKPQQSFDESLKDIVRWTLANPHWLST